MVKLFIGNLPDGAQVGNEDIRPLFEAHGLVTECEVIKNYGYYIKLYTLKHKHISNNLLSSIGLFTWIRKWPQKQPLKHSMVTTSRAAR